MRPAFNISTKVKFFCTCLILTGAMTLFQNCSNSSSKSPEAPAVVQTLATGPIYSYRSNTTGGGDMDFSIIDTGTDFTITVDRYNFTNFALNQKTMTIAKSSGPGFGSRLEGELDVINLMSGACKFVISQPANCENCLTGTWTTRTILRAFDQPSVQIYGFDACTAEFNEEKIRTLIQTSLNL